MNVFTRFVVKYDADFHVSASICNQIRRRRIKACLLARTSSFHPQDAKKWASCYIIMHSCSNVTSRDVTGVIFTAIRMLATADDFQQNFEVGTRGCKPIMMEHMIGATDLLLTSHAE